MRDGTLARHGAQDRRTNESDSHTVVSESGAATPKPSLLLIPPPVMLLFWPPERVITGMRVCKSLRLEVMPLVLNPIIEIASRRHRSSRKYIVTTILRQQAPVSLRCSRGNENELLRALLFAIQTANCPAVSRLDLTRQAWGLENAELTIRRPLMAAQGSHRVQTLAEVVARCPKLLALDLNSQCIGDKGATVLANALSTTSDLTHLGLKDNNLGGMGADRVLNSFRDLTALKTLDLSGNCIREEGIASLMALRGCTNLTSLMLCGCGVGPALTTVLAAPNVLQSWGRLSLLDLRCNDIDDEGASRLARSLLCCSSLTSLQLSHNQIGHHGIARLAKTLRRGASLEELCLGGNPTHHREMCAVAALVLHLQRLQRLEVGINQAEGALVSLHILSQALQGHSALTDLHVDIAQSCAAAAMALVAQRCGGRLRRLRLSCTSRQAPAAPSECAGAELLAALLAECPALTSVGISGAALGAGGEAGLAAWLGRCTALQRLDLSRALRSSSPGRPLARALKRCCSLTWLDLSSNSLGAGRARRRRKDEAAAAGAEEARGSVEALRAALEEGPASTLTHLDLSDNHLDARDVAHMASTLACCTALAWLSLARNNQDGGGGEWGCGLSHVWPNLLRCRALAHLDLSHNRILGRDLEGCPLSAFHQLSRLDLGHNCLGEAGAALLGRVLRASRAPLQVLSLASNDFAGEGMEALLSALVDTMARTLAVLDLSGNRLGSHAGARGDGGVLWVVQALGRLRGLRRLELRGVGLDSGGWALLAPQLCGLARLTLLDLRDNEAFGAEHARVLRQLARAGTTLLLPDV